MSLGVDGDQFMIQNIIKSDAFLGENTCLVGLDGQG